MKTITAKTSAVAITGTITRQMVFKYFVNFLGAYKEKGKILFGLSSLPALILRVTFCENRKNSASEGWGGRYTGHAIRRVGLRPKEPRDRYLVVGPHQQKKSSLYVYTC